jgi:Undecaprenyl-phosphate glucose phosphotransferase
LAWAQLGLEGSVPDLPASSSELPLPLTWRRAVRWRGLSLETIAAALAVSDFCLISTAAAAVFVVYGQAMGHPHPERYIVTTLVAGTMFIVWLERLGGYRSKRLVQLSWQLTQLLMVWGSTISILLLIAFVVKISEIYSRGWVLGSVFAAAGLLAIERCIVKTALDRCVRDGSLARRVAIIGAGEEGQRLIAKLEHSRDPSIAVCGVFDDRKSRVPPFIRGHKRLGTTNDLIRLARRGVIDEVIVALPLDAEVRLQQLFDRLKEVACDLHLSVEPMAQRFQIRGMSYVGDAPVLLIADRPIKKWGALVKWIEDKILAGILLISLSPMLALVALAIKLDSRGPVLFVQKRFGFNNDVIHVLKYRTMHIDLSDESGASRTVRGDPRVTRVGRLLRCLSLDELPQLVNVLRGDMSLVGPRPHAIAMKAGGQLYGEAVEQYSHRHRVKPGITGWAQVTGLRGEIDSIEKAKARIERDLYYIEHWSCWLDLKILVNTIGILVWPANAY